MITGIYLLKFGNLIYVGQSKDIHRRFTTHINKLLKGTHVNWKMQAAYEKYGLPTLEIILECSKEELDSAEKEAIDIYNSINTGLNISPAGGAFPVLVGQSNGFAKYSNDTIISAIRYIATNLDKPLKIVAKELNINYSTIKNISNGTSHLWLSEAVPDEYTRVLSHKGKRIINSSINKGKNYVIISPSGEQYSVNNISVFCAQHGLNAGALGEVLRGNARQHKGWTTLQQE